jgi:uncharacterized protein (TIGR02246 family)
MMKRMLTLVAVVAGAAAACSPAPPAAPDTAADVAAINQVRTDYMASFNAGDMAKLGALHTEDAIEYPANQPAREGRAAIVAAAEAMAKEGKHEISITATETLVGGDQAVDIGTFRVTMTPAAGGEPMTMDGRYIVLLRREADGWKLARLMNNTPAPMMMPGMNMPGGMEGMPGGMRGMPGGMQGMPCPGCPMGRGEGRGMGGAPAATPPADGTP